MSENAGQQQQQAADAIAKPAETAGEPAKQVEIKTVSAEPEATSTVESEKGKADEIGKELKEIKAELEKYKKAEADAKEAKLKEEGKLNELIAEKDKKIAEMEKQITDKTRVDNLKKLFKDNKVADNIIDSKFTQSIIEGDYFNEDHSTKKDAFKTISADYPFVIPRKEPNANPAAIPPIGEGIDMNSYINQQIEAYEKDPAIKQRITGEMDVLKIWTQ